MADRSYCQNCGAVREPQERQCPACGMPYQKGKKVETFHEAPRMIQPDNINLDVMDAKRLGYGAHYGHFKADHPYTKDANEARLEQMQQPARVRPVYEFVCRGCGKKFTTRNKKRRYCSDVCKTKKNSADYRARSNEKEDLT